MNIVDKNAQAVKAAEHLFNSLDIKLPEETPQRFVNMMKFLTAYNNVPNKEIAEKVNKIFEIDRKTNSKNMVILKNIDAFSLCEHHIALMYDMKISVAYIPRGFVLGLSKVVRLVDMVCKRLQLQEKIGEDILEIMKILTKSNDIAVNIKAKHSCVTARGIQNVSSETVTNHFSGAFKKSAEYQNLFLNSLN